MAFQAAGITVPARREFGVGTGAELIIGEGRFIAPKTIEVRAPGGVIRQR